MVSGRLWSRKFVYSQNISSQNVVLEFGGRLLKAWLQFRAQLPTEYLDLLAGIVLKACVVLSVSCQLLVIGLMR